MKEIEIEPGADTATVAATATASATDADADADADADGTRVAGLLVAAAYGVVVQRRPISTVMMRNESELTVLLGRAVAYLQTSTQL